MLRLRRIKAWFRKRKSDRFLKKHHCKTWAHYLRVYDPDHNVRASRITDYYHGYKHIHVIEQRDHYAYQCIYDYGPGGFREGWMDLIEWCEKNCKDKFRFDMHRAMKAPATAYQWEINELAGGDYIFAAFKDERDYMHFLLRWS